jgi:hypothetical protein
MAFTIEMTVHSGPLFWRQRAAGEIEPTLGRKVTHSISFLSERRLPSSRGWRLYYGRANQIEKNTPR